MGREYVQRADHGEQWHAARERQSEDGTGDSGGRGTGTLTLATNLSLATTSTNLFELATTNSGDFIVVRGNLSLGGSVRVSPQPGFGNGTYRLFSYGTLTTNNIPAVSFTTGGYRYNGRVRTDAAAQQVVLDIIPPRGTIMGMW